MQLLFIFINPDTYSLSMVMFLMVTRSTLVSLKVAYSILVPSLLIQIASVWPNISSDIKILYINLTLLTTRYTFSDG